jgi:hypothetical protein
LYAAVHRAIRTSFSRLAQAIATGGESTIDGARDRIFVRLADAVTTEGHVAVLRAIERVFRRLTDFVAATGDARLRRDRSTRRRDARSAVARTVQRVLAPFTYAVAAERTDWTIDSTGGARFAGTAHAVAAKTAIDLASKRILRGLAATIAARGAAVGRTARGRFADLDLAKSITTGCFAVQRAIPRRLPKLGLADEVAARSFQTVGGAAETIFARPTDAVAASSAIDGTSRRLPDLAETVAADRETARPTEATFSGRPTEAADAAYAADAAAARYAAYAAETAAARATADAAHVSVTAPPGHAATAVTAPTLAADRAAVTASAANPTHAPVGLLVGGDVGARAARNQQCSGDRQQQTA